MPYKKWSKVLEKLNIAPIKNLSLFIHYDIGVIRVMTGHPAFFLHRRPTGGTMILVRVHGPPRVQPPTAGRAGVAAVRGEMFAL